MPGQDGAFRRLVGRLTGLLNGPQKAATRRTTQRRDFQRDPDRSNDLASISHEFESRVKKIIKDSASVLGGRINLIGIGSLKKKAGDTWPRIADHVDAVVRREIEKRLAPEDLFTAWGESDYIIVFAHLTDDEAKLKCQLIAEAISKTLLGDQNTQGIDVKSAVSRVDRNPQFESTPDVGSLLERIRANRVEVDARESESSEKPRSVEAAARFGADRSAQRSSPAGPDAARYSSKAIKSPSVAPNLPIRSDAVPPAEIAVELAYRPFWKVTRNVIAAYLCTPRAAADRSIDKVPAGTQSSIADVESTPEFDFRAAHLVVDDIDRMLRRNVQCLQVLPVQFETLAVAKWRREYLAVLNGLSTEAQRLLGIRVLNVPNGIVLSRASDLIAALKPLCRSILLSMDLNVGDLSYLAQCGMDAIGSEIRQSSQTEPELISHMQRFHSMASRARCATFMAGLDTLSLAAAALGIGFSYISGDAIGSIVEKPESILPFELRDMYSNILAL